jgi:hypothetical protein
LLDFRSVTDLEQWFDAHENNFQRKQKNPNCFSLLFSFSRILTDPLMNRPQLVLIVVYNHRKNHALIELATRYGAEIIGADSRQVYQYLDITAKPTAEQRAAVPHHI